MLTKFEEHSGRETGSAKKIDMQNKRNLIQMQEYRSGIIEDVRSGVQA